MAIERKYDGFAPGLHAIEGFGRGGFRFGGMSHIGSLLVLPDGVHAFAPQTFAEVDAASLAPLFALPRGSVQLLLFGCGASLQPVPPLLRKRLLDIGIRCDPMSTSAACQTYNILLGEKRLASAVLIASP
jgi:uncharacterized protein